MLSSKSSKSSFSAFWKSTAFFLSIYFTLSESFIYALPAMAGSQNPIPNPVGAALQKIIPIPSELGFIEETGRGTNGKTILYLQDAHDSLEAQENIAKMIDYAVERYGVRTVFEEGYEGAVPTDAYFRFIKDPALKQKVSYFLLDRLRLGGAEYAHVNRKRDFNLTGADSVRLHFENVAEYRRAAGRKTEIAQDLKVLTNEIRGLAERHFPRELKDWIGLRERFESKKIGLLDYLRRLDLLAKGVTKPANSPVIRDILALDSPEDAGSLDRVRGLGGRKIFEAVEDFENETAAVFLTTERDRQIFKYYKALRLLHRLNRLEITFEEYQALKNVFEELKTRDLADFVVRLTNQPLVLSKLWEDDIESAVRFYELAQARDRVLDKVLESSGEKISVLVFGGFHKEGIKRILREKGFSYQVISPVIRSSSPRHQAYYRQLMEKGFLDAEISDAVKKGTVQLRVYRQIPEKDFASYLVRFLTPSDPALAKEVAAEIRAARHGTRDAKIELDARNKERDAPPAVRQGEEGEKKSASRSEMREPKDQDDLFLKQPFLDRALLDLRKIEAPFKAVFIMPMYNEHRRLFPRTGDNPEGEDALRVKVRQLEYLRKLNANFDWRLLAVDDGSPGAASGLAAEKLRGELALEFPDASLASRIRIEIISPRTKAAMKSRKGWAVLTGMGEALGEGWADYIGYTDTDISTNLIQSASLAAVLARDDADAAIGSRWVKGALSENVPWAGIVSSKIYNWCVRLMLPPLFYVHDTQRGFKLFKRQTLERVLPHARERGFAFDTELLLLAKLEGLRILEVPIYWLDSPRVSNVNIARDSLTMLWGVLKQSGHIYARVYERFRARFFRSELRAKRLEMIKNIFRIWTGRIGRTLFILARFFIRRPAMTVFAAGALAVGGIIYALIPDQAKLSAARFQSAVTERQQKAMIRGIPVTDLTARLQSQKEAWIYAVAEGIDAADRIRRKEIRHLYLADSAEPGAEKGQTVFRVKTEGFIPLEKPFEPVTIRELPDGALRPEDLEKLVMVLSGGRAVTVREFQDWVAWAPLGIVGLIAVFTYALSRSVRPPEGHVLDSLERGEKSQEELSILRERAQERGRREDNVRSEIRLPAEVRTILVFNCGSSSVKHQLIDMHTETVLDKGIIEDIGTVGPASTHKEAVHMILDSLFRKGLPTPDAVGHRIVHGGDRYIDPALLAGDPVKDDQIKQAIDFFGRFVPLHNPFQLETLKAIEEYLRGVPQVAVFDTAFHQTIDRKIYEYLLAPQYYEKLGIRVFGFHGISHQYVMLRAMEIMGIKQDEFYAISAHLGSGASIAKIVGGKSKNTTMGFTPLSGIPGNTRPGKMDIGMIPYAVSQQGMELNRLFTDLNKKSGLEGYTGLKGGMKAVVTSLGVKDLTESVAIRNAIAAIHKLADAEALPDEGEKIKQRCARALEIYAAQVAEAMAGYYGTMKRLDAIIFTGGIGESCPIVRRMILDELEGVPEEIKNKKVLVIPTNEELMIAKETHRVLREAIAEQEKSFRSEMRAPDPKKKAEEPSTEELRETLRQMAAMADRLLAMDEHSEANSPPRVSALYDLLGERVFTHYPNPSVISANEDLWDAMGEFQGRQYLLNFDGPGRFPRSPAGWLCGIFLAGHSSLWKALAGLSRDQFSAHMKKVMEVFAAARIAGPEGEVSDPDLYPQKIDETLSRLRSRQGPRSEMRIGDEDVWRLENIRDHQAFSPDDYDGVPLIVWLEVPESRRKGGGIAHKIVYAIEWDGTGSDLKLIRLGEREPYEDTVVDEMLGTSEFVDAARGYSVDDYFKIETIKQKDDTYIFYLERLIPKGPEAGDIKMTFESFLPSARSEMRSDALREISEIILTRDSGRLDPWVRRAAASKLEHFKLITSLMYGIAKDRGENQSDQMQVFAFLTLSGLALEWRAREGIAPPEAVSYLDWLIRFLEQDKAKILKHARFAHDGNFFHFDYVEYGEALSGTRMPPLGGKGALSGPQSEALLRQILTGGDYRSGILVPSAADVTQDPSVSWSDLQKPILTARVQYGHVEDVHLVLAPLKDGRLASFAVLTAKSAGASAAVKREFELIQPYRGDPNAAQVIALGSTDAAGRTLHGYSSRFLDGYSEIVYVSRRELTVNGEEPGHFTKNSDLATQVGEISGEGMLKIVAAFARLATYFYDPGSRTAVKGLASNAGDVNFRDDQFLRLGPGLYEVDPEIPRLDAKLMALRDKTQDVDVPQFLKSIFDLEFLADRYDNLVTDPPYDAWLREGVLQGFFQGMGEKYGAKDGEAKAGEWLNQYLSALSLKDILPSPLVKPDQIRDFINERASEAPASRSEVRKSSEADFSGLDDLAGKVTQALDQELKTRAAQSPFRPVIRPGFPEELDIEIYPARKKTEELLRDGEIHAGTRSIEVPAGTVGRAKIQIIEADGKPAIYIDTLMASYAFRKLKESDRQLYETLEYFPEWFVRAVIEVSRQLGFDAIYAKPGPLAQLQNPGMSRGDRKRYYNNLYTLAFPFKKGKINFRNIFMSREMVASAHEREREKYGRAVYHFGGDYELWRLPLPAGMETAPLAEPEARRESERLLIHHGLSPLARRKVIELALAERRAMGLTRTSVARARFLLNEFGAIRKSVPPPLREDQGINRFMSEMLGRPVRILMKDESHPGYNPTGSFKDRSPVLLYERVMKGIDGGGILPQELLVVSTGNHAAANAYAGTLARRYYREKTGRELPLVVRTYMGRDAEPHKIERVRELGGQVVLKDAEGHEIENYKQGEDIVRQLVDGRRRIQTPHADPFVVAGYSTTALEIAEQMLAQGYASGDFTGVKTALIAPVGSGGYYAGLLNLLEEFPDLRTYGVSASPANLVYRSIAKRRSEPDFKGLVREPVGKMVNDGIAATPEEYSVQMIEKMSDGLLLVPDRSTVPVLGILADCGLTVEPTSALPLVAVLLNPDLFSGIDTFVLPLTSRHVSGRVAREIRSEWSGPGSREKVLQYYRGLQKKFLAVRSEMRNRPTDLPSESPVPRVTLTVRKREQLRKLAEGVDRLREAGKEPTVNAILVEGDTGLTRWQIFNLPKEAREALGIVVRRPYEAGQKAAREKHRSVFQERIRAMHAAMDVLEKENPFRAFDATDMAAKIQELELLKAPFTRNQIYQLFHEHSDSPEVTQIKDRLSRASRIGRIRLLASLVPEGTGDGEQFTVEELGIPWSSWSQWKDDRRLNWEKYFIEHPLTPEERQTAQVYAAIHGEGDVYARWKKGLLPPAALQVSLPGENFQRRLIVMRRAVKALLKEQPFRALVKRQIAAKMTELGEHLSEDAFYQLLSSYRDRPQIQKIEEEIEASSRLNRIRQIAALVTPEETVPEKFVMEMLGIRNKSTWFDWKAENQFDLAAYFGEHPLNPPEIEKAQDYAARYGLRHAYEEWKEREREAASRAKITKKQIRAQAMIQRLSSGQHRLLALMKEEKIPRNVRTAFDIGMRAGNSTLKEVQAIADQKMIQLSNLDERDFTARQRQLIEEGRHFLTMRARSEVRGDWQKIDWPVGEEGMRTYMKLNHPALSKIRRSADGKSYEVKWVSGPRMTGWISQNALMPDDDFMKQIIDWTLEIAEATHRLREAGFNHGDLQPDNIVIDEETNRPVIIDFFDDGLDDAGYLSRFIDHCMLRRSMTVIPHQTGEMIFDARKAIEYANAQIDSTLRKINALASISMPHFIRALRVYSRARWPLEIDRLSESLMLYPKALLHSRDLEPYLDEFDRSHYQFIETEHGYGDWRSKFFPRLILGSWEDILPVPETGKNLTTKMENDVVIRFKKGDGKAVSFYFYDDHGRSVPYAMEAVARGEMPVTGNDQIFVDDHPDAHAFIPPADFEMSDLRNYNGLRYTGLDMMNFNQALAGTGFLKSHFWVVANDRFVKGGHPRLASPLSRGVRSIVTREKDYWSLRDRPVGKAAFINIDTDATGQFSTESSPPAQPSWAPPLQRPDFEFFSDVLIRLRDQDKVRVLNFHASTSYEAHENETGYQFDNYGDIRLVRYLARVAPAILLAPEENLPADRLRDLAAEIVREELNQKTDIRPARSEVRKESGWYGFFLNRFAKKEGEVKPVTGIWRRKFERHLKPHLLWTARKDLEMTEALREADQKYLLRHGMEAYLKDNREAIVRNIRRLERELRRPLRLALYDESYYGRKDGPPPEFTLSHATHDLGKLPGELVSFRDRQGVIHMSVDFFIPGPDPEMQHELARQAVMAALAEDEKSLLKALRRRTRRVLTRHPLFRFPFPEVITKKISFQRTVPLLWMLETFQSGWGLLTLDDRMRSRVITPDLEKAAKRIFLEKMIGVHFTFAAFVEPDPLLDFLTAWFPGAAAGVASGSVRVDLPGLMRDYIKYGTTSHIDSASMDDWRLAVRHLVFLMHQGALAYLTRLAGEKTEDAITSRSLSGDEWRVLAGFEETYEEPGDMLQAILRKHDVAVMQANLEHMDKAIQIVEGKGNLPVRTLVSFPFIKREGLEMDLLWTFFIRDKNATWRQIAEAANDYIRTKNPEILYGLQPERPKEHFESLLAHLDRFRRLNDENASELVYFPVFQLHSFDQPSTPEDLAARYKEYLADLKAFMADHGLSKAVLVQGLASSVLFESLLSLQKPGRNEPDLLHSLLKSGEFFGPGGAATVHVTYDMRLDYLGPLFRIFEHWTHGNFGTPVNPLFADMPVSNFPQPGDRYVFGNFDYAFFTILRRPDREGDHKSRPVPESGEALEAPQEAAVPALRSEMREENDLEKFWELTDRSVRDLEVSPEPDAVERLAEWFQSEMARVPRYWSRRDFAIHLGNVFVYLAWRREKKFRNFMALAEALDLRFPLTQDGDPSDDTQTGPVRAVLGDRGAWEIGRWMQEELAGYATGLMSGEIFRVQVQPLPLKEFLRNFIDAADRAEVVDEFTAEEIEKRILTDQLRDRTVRLLDEVRGIAEVAEGPYDYYLERFRSQMDILSAMFSQSPFPGFKDLSDWLMEPFADEGDQYLYEEGRSPPPRVKSWLETLADLRREFEDLDLPEEQRQAWKINPRTIMLFYQSLRDLLNQGVEPTPIAKKTLKEIDAAIRNLKNNSERSEVRKERNARGVLQEIRASGLVSRAPFSDGAHGIRRALADSGRSAILYLDGKKLEQEKLRVEVFAAAYQMRLRKNFHLVIFNAGAMGMEIYGQFSGLKNVRLSRSDFTETYEKFGRNRPAKKVRLVHEVAAGRPGEVDCFLLNREVDIWAALIHALSEGLPFGIQKVQGVYRVVGEYLQNQIDQFRNSLVVKMSA